MKVHRALLSVTDKSGIVDFARGLADLGVEVLSTGGTARALRSGGISVRDVAELTGFPECLDGRVKTLHPKVHGGILGRRDVGEHVREMESFGIAAIDLVAVNLYRFEEAVAGGAAMEEAIENIDIGGPSMIRSAAKNHHDVIVVTTPARYAEVLEHLRAQGDVPAEVRRDLAREAFALTSAYDRAIQHYLEGPADFPREWRPRWMLREVLRYGENPHQRAAFYVDPAGPADGLGAAEVLGGGKKELSYNNLLDLDAAWNLAREFADPAAVVVKHGNPCGAAVASTLCDAWGKALAGDPVSAFGCIVALGREVDAETAEAMSAPGNYVEAVIAPGYAKKAVRALRRGPKWGKSLRMLVAGAVPESAAPEYRVRSVRGGILVQGADDRLLEDGAWRVIVGEVDPETERDLRFAWTVSKHVHSNAIVLARDGAVVGVGAGQMSRVDAADIAARKAAGRAQGGVMASDAFIPFPDALRRVVEAGVRAVVEPGGARNDEEVIATARDLGVALVFTGMRHFRH